MAEAKTWVTGPVTFERRRNSSATKPLLSILIATTTQRVQKFTGGVSGIMDHFVREHWDCLEVVVATDSRDISVGAKRQLLLEAAEGEWIVFFDDDDNPYISYADDIIRAIQANPDADCIGFPIDMVTNGANPQRCCHSFRYKAWADNRDGWDYVRTITHFNPVRRSAALKAGFKDMRFGEDQDYSMRLMQHLNREAYIPYPLFLYQYSTQEPHEQKYGIR
jgi:cellulose synthase/poly-beta-1,6-N-acetylglucosamine synthase-like glycosyltransferase